MGRLKLLKFGFGAPELFLTQQVDLRTHGDGFENSLRNIASHNGLAYLVSPQVGQFYRTLVMLKPPYLKKQQWSGYKNLKNSHFRALMNPVIADKSLKEKQVWEECVGYPGLRLKMLRSEKVIIKYNNERKYQELQQQVEGFEATIIQQATDHLEAIDPLMIARGVEIKDPKLKEQHGNNINQLFTVFAQKRLKDMNVQGDKWKPFRRNPQFNRLRQQLVFCITDNSCN